ncbi:MAG: hypothetical protein ACKO0X_06630, partial [Bacteroidota bacterium]
NLHNLFFQLPLDFGNNFFDARRVNPTIGYQLMKCQSSQFPTDWIESGKDDSLGGIINYDFNSSP